MLRALARRATRLLPFVHHAIGGGPLLFLVVAVASGVGARTLLSADTTPKVAAASPRSTPSTSAPTPPLPVISSPPPLAAAPPSARPPAATRPVHPHQKSSR